jgi:hypothetical protein
VLDDSVLEDWPLWRLVKERVASLEELSTVYTLTDCLTMNAVLDMRDDIEAIANADAEKKAGKP